MSMVVPYITGREGEEGCPLSMLGVLPKEAGEGLCYRTERPYMDRDQRGVLHARCSQSLDGSGRLYGEPRWGEVHPFRQREMMTALRCQVCTEPASKTEAGYLFLAPHTPHEGMLTAQPPLCEPCANTSMRLCPHPSIPVRVKVPRLYGVYGVHYEFHARHGLQEVTTPEDDETFSYRDSRIKWVLASQVVRKLSKMTPVELGIDPLP